MIYPASFEQKIGFDRLREQVAARCTMRAARERIAAEDFSTSPREIERRQALADEMRLLLDMEHEFPGGEYPDTDVLIAKLRVEGSFLDVEEVATLRRALSALGGVVSFILAREERYPALYDRTRGVESFPEIVRRIDGIVDRLGEVRDDASPALLEIRRAIREREGQAAKRLQAVLASAKGAGIGAGIYKDHNEAFATLKRLDVIEPDEANRAAYLAAYANWKRELAVHLGE